MGSDDSLVDEHQVSAMDEVRTANADLKSVLEASVDEEQAFGMSLRDAVREVSAAIARHQELAEAPGGNVEFILSEKPALSPWIERQRAEHGDMAARATYIEGLIGEQLAFDRMNVEMLRLEARVLSDIVELHISRARDMLYEAMYTVEGGEQG